MAFAQIVENRNSVAFIEQQLGANTADIAGATDNENFHPRENRRPAPLINPKCDPRISPQLALQSAFWPKIDWSSKIGWNSKPRGELKTDSFFAKRRPSFELGRVSYAGRALG